MFDRFGDIRSELHGEPSSARWDRLCALLDGMGGAHLSGRVLPYVRESLERWPDRLRVAPRRWVERLVYSGRCDLITLTKRVSFRHHRLRLDTLEVLLGSPSTRALSFVDLGANVSGAPALEMELGEMKLIERTRATRTFVRVKGDGEIRRLQANLKTLTDTGLPNWREKKILSINKAAMDRIEVKHAGGQEFTLGVSAPPGEGERNAQWEIREPKTAWPIEQSAAQGLANSLGNMSASGFVDDGDAAALGLDPPQFRLKVHSDEIVDVQASKVGETFYARVGKGAQIFEVTSFHGERLTRGLAGYRSLSLFGADPEAARKTINKWVEGATAQRIKDLLPKESITSDVMLVLTNAIYFKASWFVPFNESATAPGDFQVDASTTVQADMMNQSSKNYGYAKVGDVEVVELDYDGNEMSMVLLLPEAGELGALESSLDVATLEGYLGAIQYGLVDLTLPKFEFETEFALSDALKALGMVDAFGAADLSGIDGTTGLSVFEVFHKTFVAVDEEGTEAAAATGVVVGETSVPTLLATVKADRPFMFLIRDKQTDAILFIGRVADPS